MKRILLIASALLTLSAPTRAQQVDGAAIGDLRIVRNGDYLTVDMNVDLSDLRVEDNRAVLLTPRILRGNDSLDLASIGVYGRRRYFYYLRNGELPATGEGEMTYRAAERPENIRYEAIFPYAQWMNGSSLVLYRADYGCCKALLDEQRAVLGRYAEPEPFIPRWVYVRPEAERVKSRSLSGSAFIDFPVNKTVIYPDYRRNTVELGKIEASIDSVRNDADVTITSVWLKGYASPESPYSHNTQLAIGRTAALKGYIQQLYHFDEHTISTDYEPEDWAGLRRYVERSNLDHRTEILALIDSDYDPDDKEARIKRAYPDEYKFLLQHCYPALRHTDYKIDYTIRTFSDPDEIRRMVKTHPQKLSLDEFYIAAQVCEPGSDEFDYIFETAVRMYPDDAIANLNAANTAMQRGDRKNAEAYLAKAGDSPQALYARAICAVLREDYPQARALFEQALAGGVAEAEEALEQLTRTEETITK